MIEQKISAIDISSNLDFIFRHLKPPIFPRTISTKNTAGRQLVVCNMQEISSRFRDSNFIDCRINAHPIYDTNPPNFIFIDLDRSNFRTDAGLKRALNDTLNNIRHKLNGQPTVLWTGCGYHIYQPINAIPLEHVADFNTVENPSTCFLRFSARFLSNNKSDPNNYQSTKSCLLRLPSSFNSKNNNQVKIIHEWDGDRPNFNLLLGSFYANHVSEKMKSKRLLLKSTRAKEDCSSILWIERLLQIGIEDFRKTAVSLILAPYLINIKHLSCQESYEIIISWLMKCNSLRHVDSSFSRRVKYILFRVAKNGYLPLSQESLRARNYALYDRLMQ